MANAEQLSLRRSRLLLLNGIAFASWQGGQLVFLVDQVKGLALTLTAVGALVWFTTLLMALKIEGDRAALAVLEDELTHHNRYRAVHWGFWAVIIVAGGALGVASFATLSAVDVARAVLLSGVSSALIRFAVLEQRDGSK